MSKSNKRLVVLFTALAIFGWALFVGLNYIDDGDAPPETAFPDVPPGAAASGIELECGSGGCWREMAIPAESAADAAEIINAMDLAEEHCGTRNILTLSRICTGAHHYGDEVRVYLAYSY